ncbi:MAG: hypothetical protein PHQ27_04270 [Victivallales bacterium]|nr:hypothetical protein [Victivallales bacterium]
MAFSTLSTRDDWGRPRRYRSAGEAWLAPTGGNDSHTTTLLHFDGAAGSSLLLDSSRYQRAFSAYGNVTLTDARSTALNGICAVMNGGSSISTSDSNELVIGTSAFTDEIRCWPTSIEGTAAILERRPDGSNTGYVLRINNYAWEVAIGTTASLASSQMPSMSQFTHLAVVGNGGADGARTLKLYVDGVCVGTSITDYNFSSTMLKLGAYYLGGENYSGYLDECRLSLHDRTADPHDPLYIPSGSTTFTPPTAAYH